ncbi:IclR family transcriptional regulator [Octadecabacter ascidiaceicola]|uniref:Pectin degradation repressor protein KdgR n=1 Tax=Octadecabacter ascidiaceicola TaxID=1655543 RepID=A0A238KPX3_9RHOB|nr:IclR family transcriptional regulator [Octadecabacter ascidiaceicola]SMX44681.1 Pectin degradation repressor protein KdgR [Octadecabacter ascidiaceicola]
MSSVTKALDLLSHFSAARAEIGLSQLCRIAKRDKATTYRHLQALEVAGFVEQNPTSKQYRLGPAVLQLAQTREATVPRKASTERPLFDLTETTGETAHVTVLSGTKMFGLAVCDSPRHGTRAIIDIDVFPLHATASGLCALAFGPKGLMDVALADLTSFTTETATTPSALSNTVDAIRQTGFGRAMRSYETEIEGVSAPLFDQTGQFAGAVSVASVATRFTPALEHTIKEHLMIASRDITHNWGGTIPSHIEGLWAKSLTTPHALDSTS